MSEAATVAAADDAARWPADARFALYYAPPRASGWWQSGCAWLGRDAGEGGDDGEGGEGGMGGEGGEARDSGRHGQSGEAGDSIDLRHPREIGDSGPLNAPGGLPALSRPLAELTDAPRRYGWHGTLVPPFRLAAGVSAAGLLLAAKDWASSQTGFTLAVEAATLGDFVALRPVSADGDTQMGALAAAALRALAPLRASPAPAELARRLQAPLTERQRELLVEWGYPYVFDEFRFHMTLSNSLSSARDRAAIVAWWRGQIGQLGALPFDGVALFVEPAPGAPFVLWQRVPFRAGEVKAV
jgi:hypothetical protein